MKRFLLILLIFIISFAGARTFFADKFDWQPLDRLKESFTFKSSEAALTNEAAPLKTRDVSLLDKDTPKLPDHILLDVPLINQMDKPMLYNGCEVASLAMVLNFHGVEVTKNELADKIKTVPFTYSDGKKGNPNEGFVGDMPIGPGLGVFNGPIFELAQQYVGDQAVNLTNSPFSDVLMKVGQGLPVWIITTSNFVPVSNFRTWDTPQGKIEITFSMHSAVITGYDEEFIYVNDPYGTKNRKVKRESFIKAWEQMGSQAIVIDK